MKHALLPCFFLLVCLLTGCRAGLPAPSETAAPAGVQPAETSAPTESTQPTVRPTGIDILMDEMSLREKVGQLFIVRPDALDLTLAEEQVSDSKASGVTELTEAMAEALKEYPVGGVVMFSKNITSPSQITAFNEALQNASEIPLFISVDEEGGLVSRLANHAAFALPQYESPAAVGSTGDSSRALEMGSTIGTYLKEYGFNMDLAPVADVNTKADNPVIGSRAFSSDAATAARMAAACADGLRGQDIIAVFKHFPGHGDTAEDSHSQLAVSYKTEEDMRSCEWLPFLEAQSGDCVMVGHIAVPNITGDLTPATMSYQIVTECLKNQLGFDGLVITDSLSMGAVTESYTPGEAALGALEAGCDLLLMPTSLQEAFDAVVAAVEDGTYSEEALNAAVRRILQFKLDHDLLSFG